MGDRQHKRLSDLIQITIFKMLLLLSNPISCINSVVDVVC